jgi:hypothetical protein
MMHGASGATRENRIRLGGAASLSAGLQTLQLLDRGGQVLCQFAGLVQGEVDKIVALLER